MIKNMCAFSFRRWVNGCFLSGQLKNYLLMKMTVFSFLRHQAALNGVSIKTASNTGCAKTTYENAGFG